MIQHSKPHQISHLQKECFPNHRLETTGFPDGEFRCKDSRLFQKCLSQHKTLGLNISSGMTRHRPARSQPLKRFYRRCLLELQHGDRGEWDIFHFHLIHQAED